MQPVSNHHRHTEQGALEGCGSRGRPRQRAARELCPPLLPPHSVQPGVGAAGGKHLIDLFLHAWGLHEHDILHHIRRKLLEGLHHHRKELRDLHRSRSRQHGEPSCDRSDALIEQPHSCDLVDQRMPDVACSHTVRGVEIDLEWEDAQHLTCATSHHAHPAAPPRPELW